MKKYNIKAQFLKDYMYVPSINLVKQDYNFVELDFEFDIVGGTKTIEIKKPDGTYWVKEIVNDKIVLVDTDDDDELVSVIDLQGEYKFEISYYGTDSKYTISTIGKFYARDEVVNVDDDDVSENSKLPILDNLINSVTSLNNTITTNENTRNTNENTRKSNETTRISNENSRESYITQLKQDVLDGKLDGASFNYLWNGTKLGVKNSKEQVYSYVDLKGDTGEKGEKGDAGSVKFVIVETLPAAGIDESAIYLVPSSTPETQNVYDEYIHTDNGWERLGSTPIEIDLTNYVKNTDYATSSKGGVVKVYGGTYGVEMSDGALKVVNPTTSDIDSRSSGRKALNTAMLDYAVKRAMTDGVGAAWTDTEKANARTRMGIDLSSYATKTYVQEYVNSLNSEGVSY